MEENRKISVLDIPISILTWDQALKNLVLWGNDNSSKYVCICNVHSIVTANRNDLFKSILSNSDMATPDGAPVSWFMRINGETSQQRINGPDLMWKYCDLSRSVNYVELPPIFLYGGIQSTVDILCSKLIQQFPSLRIAGSFSPPFRDLADEEDEFVIQMINSSGAGVVWVSLGCPKQEQWMAQHKNKIFAVLVGVGAAFDYHAGTVGRAPLWMQQSGFEWLFRLLCEPRRLWKRYLTTNFLFIFLLVKWYAGRKASTLCKAISVVFKK